MYAHLESLENRTMLTGTYPLDPVTIATNSVMQTIDASGNKSILPVGRMVSGDYEVVPFHGSLYVRSGHFLYRSDGTKAGTQKIAGDDGTGVHVDWVGTAGENLYYIAQAYDNAEHEDYGHIYKLDTANNSWASVTGIYGDLHARISSGQLFVELNRYVPYSIKFYSINGAIATQVDSLPAPDPVTDATAATVNDVQFYAYDDGVHGNELWKNDGTAALAYDGFAGATSSNPHGLLSFGGRLVYIASAPSIGSIMGASIIGRTLFVSGTLHDDKVVISSADGMTNVSVVGPVSIASVAAFDDADFDQIYVATDSGQDLLDLSQTAKPCLIFSGAGNDTIRPGTGNDTIDGGSQPDVLDYSGRTENLSGGRNKITSGTETDQFQNIATLLCGSGDDTISLFTLGGVSPYSQNSSYDSIRYMDGGAGNDVLSYYDTGGNYPIAPTIHGGAGDDAISGARYGTMLNGQLVSGGTVVMYGDDGEDLFDIYRTDCNRDIHGGAGIDSVDYRSFSTAGGLYISLDDKPGDGPHGTDNVHSDVEVIYGSVFNDTIIGTSHDDTIVGSTGADLLIGNGGTDSIVSDQYDTVLDYLPETHNPPPDTNNPPPDTQIPPPVVTSTANVTLKDRVLRVDGSGNADSISIVRNPLDATTFYVANAWPMQTVYRFSDVDLIDVFLGAGNDVLHAETITVPLRVHGGAGNDVIYGSAASDRIIGDAGDDWISGGAGNDTLYGNEGNDRLFGGTGKDYISGGTGVNVFRGGDGLDRILGIKSVDDYRGNRGDIIKLVLG